MKTIQKNVKIPANHELHVDVSVPLDIPEGDAEVLLLISPVKSKNNGSTIVSLAGALAESANFSKDPLLIQKEMRDEWE